jgi:hypothetical protein
VEFDLADNADMAETGRSNPALPGRSFPAKCAEGEETGDGIILDNIGLFNLRPSMFESKFECSGWTIGVSQLRMRGQTAEPCMLVSNRGDNLRMVVVLCKIKLYLLITRFKCCIETLSERLIHEHRLIAARPCDHRPSIQSPLHKFSSVMTARS